MKHTRLHTEIENKLVSSGKWKKKGFRKGIYKSGEKYLRSRYPNISEDHLEEELYLATSNLQGFVPDVWSYRISPANDSQREMFVIMVGEVVVSHDIDYQKFLTLMETWNCVWDSEDFTIEVIRINEWGFSTVFIDILGNPSGQRAIEFDMRKAYETTAKYDHSYDHYLNVSDIAPDKLVREVFV